MHPDFLQLAISEHERALEANLRFAGLDGDAGHTVISEADDVVLRLCAVRDDGALERLAALEGREVPKGRHVVAEVGGAVIASLPLLGGAPLADPFRRTSHLLPLLELRAHQLEPRRGTRAVWLRTVVRGLSPARW